MREGATSRRDIGRTGAELQRALERSPDVCPVCGFVAEGVRQYVDALFYERVTDREMRASIREARGFCRRHTRLVRQQADALGTSLIFVDVFTNELRDIASGRLDRPAAPSSGNPLTRFFEGSQSGTEDRPPCPICVKECDLDEATVDNLLSAMADEGFAAVYTGSGGMCLPHFRLAFRRARDLDIWRSVLEVQRRALQGMVDGMSEFARKNDYRFRHEAVGDEGGTWQRALNVSAGWQES